VSSGATITLYTFSEYVEEVRLKQRRRGSKEQGEKVKA
jgi:hypothetical protein